MKLLPLLEAVKEEYDLENPERICMIGVQHLLPTTVSLIEALIGKGVKAENISLLGKCYSTDMRAYVRLKELGVDVCAGSLLFAKDTSYDDVFDAAVESFIKKRMYLLNDERFSKVILLDDGGHLLGHVIERDDLDFSRLIGVEQTSSGYNRLKELDLNIPVINLARARVKLQAEPSVIVENAVSKILAHFDQDEKSKKALVIGNGYIGGKVKELLSANFDVQAFDLCGEKSDFSTEQLGFRIGEFDLIVGCTGACAVPNELYSKMKKGAVLASVSSSDREFDSAYLRARADMDVDTPFTNVDALGLKLLNCGFPMNFNGSDDADDPNFFQLIRALIFASIHQANFHCHDTTGLIPLCDSRQHAIYQLFKRESAHSKEKHVWQFLFKCIKSFFRGSQALSARMSHLTPS